MRLKTIICNVGEDALVETKRGRKARKNTDSLGLRILIRKPLLMINHTPLDVAEESSDKVPVSRHIAQARYKRYAAPAYLID